MGTNIAVWHLGSDPDATLEKLTIIPGSLDMGTRELPQGGYTTFRTFEHYKVLRLGEHFERLEQTARLAGKPLSLDRPRILAALRQAMAAYPSEEIRVRVILDLEQEIGSLYFLLDALVVPTERDYITGVRIVTKELHRDNPKAKLTTFIETADQIRQTLPPGINEALMVGEDGHVLEGLSSNFFAVKDGKIWTAEQGVLSGITRSMVLDAARALNIEVVLVGVRYDELRKLEEAFITSASRAVLPVSEIDGFPVNGGMPGLITQKLLTKYRQMINSELVEVSADSLKV